MLFCKVSHTVSPIDLSTNPVEVKCALLKTSWTIKSVDYDENEKKQLELGIHISITIRQDWPKNIATINKNSNSNNTKGVA